LVLVACVRPEATPMASNRDYKNDPFVDGEKFKELVFRHDVVGIENTAADIPCITEENIIPQRPKLILWYKEEKKFPIYSLDLRSYDAWTKSEIVGERGYVHFEPLNNTATPGAWLSSLRLGGLRREDAGVYRCRIDFANLPTYNAWVKVNVLVPPKPPVIQTDKKVLAGRTDLIKEGESVQLYCITEGVPTPTINWLYNNSTIKPFTVQTEVSGYTRSSIILKDVRRTANHKYVTCTVNNSVPSVHSLSRTVQLDVVLPPTRVDLVNKQGKYEEGLWYNISCRVYDSNPIPAINLLIGNKEIALQDLRIGPEGSYVEGSAKVRFAEEDRGEYIRCLARNEFQPTIVIQDQHLIALISEPQLRVEPWDFTNMDEHQFEYSVPEARVDTTEGDNMTLHCAVAPPGYFQTIYWFRKGIQLRDGKNLQLNKKFLHIQNINRNMTGEYNCLGIKGNREKLSTGLIVDVVKKELERCSVTECEAVNQTYTSFTILCDPCTKKSANCRNGDCAQNSGLTGFNFLVLEAQTQTIVRNISSNVHNVTINNLQSSKDFQVYIQTVRAGQEVELDLLEAYTLRSEEKAIAASTERQSQQRNRMVVMCVIGAIFGFSTVPLFFLAVLFRRMRARRRRQEHSSSTHTLSSGCPVEETTRICPAPSTSSPTHQDHQCVACLATPYEETLSTFRGLMPDPSCSGGGGRADRKVKFKDEQVLVDSELSPAGGGRDNHFCELHLLQRRNIEERSGGSAEIVCIARKDLESEI